MSNTLPSTILYNKSSATESTDKASLFNKYFLSVFNATIALNSQPILINLIQLLVVTYCRSRYLSKMFWKLLCLFVPKGPWY